MSSNGNQFDPKFMMKALMNEMKRMMKGEMNQIHEQLDRIEFNQLDQPQNTTMGIREGKFNRGKIELKMMNLIVKALMKMTIDIPAKGDMVDSLEKHGKGKMIVWVVLR